MSAVVKVFLCVALQVFHCVHFECPANLSALAASELEQKSAATAAHDSSPSNVVQPMDIGTARPGDNAASTVQQQPHMRLQGLRQANAHDDMPGVDHGDGYGIGLLGRGRSPPPSDAT